MRRKNNKFYGLPIVKGFTLNVLEDGGNNIEEEYLSYSKRATLTVVDWTQRAII